MARRSASTPWHSRRTTRTGDSIRPWASAPESFSTRKPLARIAWSRESSRRPNSSNTHRSARLPGDLRRLETEPIDYLPGLSSSEKKARLSRISYRDYLRDLVKVEPSVIELYQSRTHGEWGVGIDAVSALDVWPFGLPGLQGLKLDPGSAPHMGYTAAGYADGSSYKFHFPDGNASIARLLVRSLVQQAVPGSTVEDVVTARIDYGRLDRTDNTTRIRLGSTAVSAGNSALGDSPVAVEVVYSRMDRAFTVHAKHCVLGCWNTMIPYLCPQLPERQKTALRYLVKVPLVYTNVALRNWRAFAALG